MNNSPMMMPQMCMPYGQYMHPMNYYPPMMDPRGGNAGKGSKGSKGHKGTKGATKGTQKGVAAADLGYDKPDAYCKCCGGYGHHKKDCWHAEKECEICGKKGHLRRVCWEYDDAKDDQKDNTKDDSKDPWPCVQCGVWNEDSKKKKCRTKDCKGTLQSKAVNQDDTPKSAISKDTMKLLEKTEPDVLKKEIIDFQTEIQELERQVEYNEAKDFKECGGKIDMTGTKKVIEVKKKMVQDRQSYLDVSPAIKNLSGDQKRENDQHFAKMNKMKEDLSNLKSSQTARADTQKRMKEEEETRYKKAMAMLEETFETEKEKTINVIKELEVKITKEEEEHLRKNTEISTVMKEKVNKGASGNIQGGTAASMPEGAGVTMVPVLPGNIIHSNSVNPAEVWSQLTSDPGLTGFSEEQAALVTRKVLEIMMKQSMQVGAPQKQPPEGQLPAGSAAAPAPTTAINEDEEMTDIELSEDEVEAERANAEEKGEAVPSKKRRVTKAAKKKILLKKGQKTAR
jgi:hypothetical protein